MAILGHAEVFAVHRALRCTQHGTARVFELFARLQQRLVADGLWLSDVFGNNPVPLEQRRVIGALMGASPLDETPAA